MTRSQGFTLLELLVAVTLLGLLMAGLFGGLRLGARAWEVSGERLEHTARVQIVQDFLRRRLAQLLPVPAEPADDRYRIAFRGTGDAVSFVGVLPERIGAGLGVMSVELDHEARALELRWRPYRGDRTEAVAVDDAEARVLLRDVARLQFEYFGAPEPASPLAWRTRWDSATALPRLIRMRVAFSARGDERWPELLVRPMIDTTLAQRF